MPTIKLTQAAVDKLKPPAAGRVEFWDSQCPGFGLRVSAPARNGAGRKTWVAMYRVDGKLVRETIGTLATFPNVGDARELARASLQKAAKGVHPVEERRQQKLASEARARDTLGTVIDLYLERYAIRRMRPDYYKETKRALEVDVKGVLGARPVGELTRREIRDLLGAIVTRGRAPHASHVLAYLRAMLNWTVGEELIEVNPAAGIPDPDPRKRQDRERDRYLKGDELRLFWLGCDQIGWPFGPLFQLLLLTAARRDELACAKRDEFDLPRRIWTLPRSRAKNDKEHVTFLSELAITILEALPQPDKSGFLFTTNGRTPVSGFGRARARLAGAMQELNDGVRVPPFTLHDLRRSAASGMAEELKIAPHVVDRILNHAGGTIRGVARVYNKAKYLEEREAALGKWARHIEKLIGLERPAPDNVFELPRAG
jgi:integrase